MHEKGKKKKISEEKGCPRSEKREGAGDRRAVFRGKNGKKQRTHRRRREIPLKKEVEEE